MRKLTFPMPENIMPLYSFLFKIAVLDKKGIIIFMAKLHFYQLKSNILCKRKA